MNTISQGPRQEIIPFNSLTGHPVPDSKNHRVVPKFKELNRGQSFNHSSRKLRQSMSCPDLKSLKKSNSQEKENNSPKFSVKSFAQKIFGKLSPQQAKREKTDLLPTKTVSQPAMSSTYSPSLLPGKIRNLASLNLDNYFTSYKTSFREGEKYENFKEIWSQNYEHLTAKYKIVFYDRNYMIKFSCLRKEIEDLIIQTEDLKTIMISDDLISDETSKKYDDFKLTLNHFLEIINKKQ
jgi:hypothetical protein